MGIILVEGLFAAFLLIDSPWALDWQHRTQWLVVPPPPLKPYGASAAPAKRQECALPFRLHRWPAQNAPALAFPSKSIVL